MQFDMFGGDRLGDDKATLSVPILGSSGVWVSPETAAFNAALRAGSLSDAVAVLKNLKRDAMGLLLLQAGFQISSTKSRKELLAFVGPQILAACRRGMDGHALQLAQATESAAAAVAVGDESFNSANYAVSFMAPVAVGDFVTHDDGFNYVVDAVAAGGVKPVQAIRPTGSALLGSNARRVVDLSSDAAKLAKERYVVERALAIKNESEALATTDTYAALIDSSLALDRDMNLRLNGLVYTVVFVDEAAYASVDIERVLAGDGLNQRVEALSIPRAVAVAARHAYFPDVASFHVDLARSQVPVMPFDKPWQVLVPESNSVAVESAAKAITSEMAANFERGVRVVDSKGVEYEAFSARHGYLQVFPVGANGKAEVFAGNSVFFHLDPGSAAAFESRRHDPIYLVPELATTVEVVKSDETIANSVASFVAPVHSTFIDDAVVAAEKKESSNGFSERRVVRGGIGEANFSTGGGGESGNGSMDVGLARGDSGPDQVGTLSGVADGPSGEGTGRTGGSGFESTTSGGPRNTEVGGDSSTTASVAPSAANAIAVVLPQAVSEAIAADMAKQKARMLRLQSVASLPGATLEQRLGLQEKANTAQQVLRQMRLAVFEVEDEVLKSIEGRNATLPGARASLFPLTEKALAAHVASMVLDISSTVVGPEDSYIGRSFNTVRGRATFVSLVAKAKPDYGMKSLYEYKTEDGAYFRVYEDQIEETIARNEHDATPQGLAESQARRIAFEQSQIAVETAQAKVAAERAALNARLDLFIGRAGFTPIKAGLARKTLLSQIRHDGEVLHKFELVEKLVGQGYQAVTSEADRIAPMSRRAFNRALGWEQDAHDKRVREAGKKTVYRLEGDKSYVEIGAFEFAFANFLGLAQGISSTEQLAIDAENATEVADSLAKGLTMATDVDVAHLFGVASVSEVAKEQTVATSQETDSVVTSELNWTTHAQRLAAQIGMFDAELEAEFSAIAARDQARIDARKERLAAARAKTVGDTSAWDQSVFAPRIHTMLNSLANAGDKGLEMRAVIHAGINMDAKNSKLTEDVVAFREKVAQRELATIAQAGIRPVVDAEVLTAEGMIALEPVIANLPTPIVDAAIVRLNALGQELAGLGFAHYHDVDPRAPKDAQNVAMQMRGVTSAMLLLAPIRERIAKGYKTAKQSKLDRMEDYATEVIGIDTRRYPGVLSVAELVAPGPVNEFAKLAASIVAKSQDVNSLVPLYEARLQKVKDSWLNGNEEDALQLERGQEYVNYAEKLLAAVRGEVALVSHDGRIWDGEGPDANELFADEPAMPNPASDMAVLAQESLTAPTDFVITDTDQIGLGSSGEKFRDNLRAIQITRELAAQARTATASEMGELARYVGWGGLKGVFDPNSKQWARQHETLRGVLTDAEWDAARRSMLNAHYTSTVVVKAMYSAVTRLGFNGGRVLEPSVGVGNFLGMMPESMRQSSELHGVELDVLTSEIVAALYPSAKIAKGVGFQAFDTPAGYFDMAIGNPPFGAEAIVDDKGSVYSGWSQHNYFFAKSVDMLRPGGIMPMVVSHNFLDKLDPHVRQWIARRAELVSGVRLPNTAFKENAGTDVVTDILVFRRLDFENTLGASIKPDWLETTDISIENPKTGEHETVAVNNYFLNNPQNVLGVQLATGSQYRANEYTVEASGDLAEQLATWVETLPSGIYTPLDRSQGALSLAEANEIPANIVFPEFVKEGSFFVFDSKVYQRYSDAFGEKRAVNWEVPNQRAAERMKGMIELRDMLRQQIRLERSELGEGDVEAGRKHLNRVYDGFKSEFGFVNDPVNARLFRADTESALVQSLEFNYEKAMTAAKAAEYGVEPSPAKADKADIFSRRVLFPPGEIEVVQTAKDALLHSLNNTGGVDMAYMQQAYGKGEAEIVAELGDLLFMDPQDGLVTADCYLSGDVKSKLDEATKAVALNRAYERNVEALKAVIPKDKLPSEIHAAIGAAWIPPKVFSEFAAEISGASIAYEHLRATGNWFSHTRGTVNFTKNNSEFGTEQMGALDILLLNMNSRAPEIKKRVVVDGRETYVTDEEKTEAVRQKADKIKTHWESWVWTDASRADELTGIYNDRFNRSVERKYDGSHLTFPGMSPALSLLAHQKNGVWRGLQDRVMLMDQVVGAGKTYEGVAMMMEMRRLGIAKKPLIVVPNHLTLQWRSEFYKLYPGANVLAATPQDFDKENRERFFSKITTGSWDAVILGHSSLKKLQVPVAVEQKIIREQFDDLSEAIEAIKRDRGDRNVIRDMEKIKQNLEAKLVKLQEKGGKKDNVVDFGDLGIDALFVDEMHEFKNLFFTTQMNRVAGLGNPAGSGKAFDLFVKIRWLQETFGEQTPLITATGTPISNSLAEMFTMQRYMQYSTLKANGLHVFDTWAKQYGDVQNVYEVAPSGTGYRLSQRFAKFKNLGSLMGEYRSFSDVITLDDLKAQEVALGRVFPVPKLEGGKPLNIVADRSELQVKFFGIPEIVRSESGHIVFELNANLPTRIEKNSEDKFSVFQTDANEGGIAFDRVMPRQCETEQEAAYMAALAAVTPRMTIDPKSIVGQFENLRELTRSTKGKINALSLTGLANKAGLDYRIIDADAPDFPDSKVNKAVANILATAKKWEADKGTQLVFCDLSVPLSAKARMGSKEKRVYVRDAGGQLTHKKGTMHAAKGFDGLPYFLVQEGKGTSKSFTMYDPSTGAVLKDGLDSKSAGQEFAAKLLSDDGGVDRWMATRESMPAIAQEEIDDYKNEHSLDAEGDAADLELSLADIEGAAGVAGFSVYDDMKAKLVAQGFPAHQIEFIHDHDSPQAKDLLFKRVNAGDVRVLFGSTPKMGAGTNVQERLVALHHIDAPWRPSDLEQREGRIIRRGNQLYARDPEGFRIQVNRYATAQTYDTRRWQLLEHKAAGLEQLRNYSGVSEMEDVANEAANSADMKAAASGNPLILKETQLATEVKKLKLLERAHRDGDYVMRATARYEREYATTVGPKLLSGFKALKLQMDGADALGVVGSRKLQDKEAVMKALDGIHARMDSLGTRHTLVYRGLKFEFERDVQSIFDRMHFPDGTAKMLDVFSRSGIVTRMDNWCDGIEREIDWTAKRIATAAKKAVEVEALLGKPFEFVQALQGAITEHGKVQRALMQSNALAAVKPADAREFSVAVAVQKAKMNAMGFADALAELERGADAGEATVAISSLEGVVEAEVPQAVRGQVQWALAQLREVESALDGVQLARGKGHILSLEVKDQTAKLERPNEILAEFRKHAQANGVDADALILELGGIAGLARFSSGEIDVDAASTFKVGSVELQAFTKESRRGTRVWGVKVIENGNEINAADGSGSWFKSDTKAAMVEDLNLQYSAVTKLGDAMKNESNWRKSFGLAPIENSVAAVPEYFSRFEAAMTRVGFGVDKAHGVYGLALQHAGQTAVVAWCYPGADDSLPGEQGRQKIVVRGFVPGGTKQDTFYFDNEASFEKALSDSLMYVDQRFAEAFKSIDAQIGVAMESYVKVAADSIGELRKSDVYRVLVESNRARYRPAIASYIKQARPDLAGEVDTILSEVAGEAALASVAGEKQAPLFSPVSPEGYASVLADTALQLEYQDELDGFFSARVVGVRNALRGDGWDGEQYSRTLSKDGMSAAFVPMQVGSGANVVGGRWKLLAVDQLQESLNLTSVAEVVDTLAVDDAGLAVEIEAARVVVMERRKVNALKSPQELSLAEFAEVATVKKLLNHGRKWEVSFGGRSGFCDSPTVPLALREAHSDAVSNALYSHTADAPEFLAKAVFPSEAVLAEYPELKVKFGEVFAGRELASVGAVAVAATGPAMDHLKTRMVDLLALDFPVNWLVMNAPRPLLGHKMLEGEFLAGRFYAGIDPDDSMADAYVRENEKLDARLVVVLPREDQMGVVLKDNFYREKYLAIEPGKRFEMLRPSFEKVRDMPYGELVAALKSVKDVVVEGSFSGAIVSVAHGLAVQRVGRDGATVCHDAANLSAAVRAGDVVDVRYRDGVGEVSGLQRGAVER